MQYPKAFTSRGFFCLNQNPRIPQHNSFLNTEKYPINALKCVLSFSSQNPWPTRESSPPLLWAKTASLTEDTFRPSHHRAPLPAQHYSDPFLPRENWRPQGRGPAASGYPHPSYARYHSNLQRQRAFDNVQYGTPGNLQRGRGTTGGQSAFQPVLTGFRKHGQQVPHGHLQVPSHYSVGHGSHHNSNPHF